MQAIQSSTIVAAECIGWNDRLGSIAPGKLADVIAVPGNATEELESFENVYFVMKGGEVVTEAAGG
jgi:imidazolonepropionase-like amidohydrolase